MPNNEMLYFGRWGKETGHFLRTAKNHPVPFRKAELPWSEIDAVLCPHHDGQPVPAQDIQEEGLAQIHHKDKWTALAFWDRSENGEFGSNSVFFVEEDLSFDEMATRAKTLFPEIFERHQFSVHELKS